MAFKEGKNYFKLPWMVRNNYIDVILDRSELTVKQFQKDNFKEKLIIFYESNRKEFNSKNFKFHFNKNKLRKL